MQHLLDPKKYEFIFQSSLQDKPVPSSEDDDNERPIPSKEDMDT